MPCDTRFSHVTSSNIPNVAAAVKAARLAPPSMATMIGAGHLRGWPALVVAVGDAAGGLPFTGTDCPTERSHLFASAQARAASSSLHCVPDAMAARLASGLV